ncbi:hypothetical protein M3201_13565 [Paenibacillus motobuensis]|uniref:hypothetical protein n=1 Tax=Paenibacillus TaxID=44249 RepID=UPI00203BF8A3|nr:MULTISPECIES: hypothetical protein [Paenibacillus]MCM3040726.1 hypothetical protein [Paenibacillus lutimineralis]MCM3647830.1 hypothetical protein [Paenibacillus motobuensis]
MTVDPYTALAVAFRDNAMKKANEVLSGLATDLGTLTATGLKLDQFKHEIKDYYVAEFPGTLKLPDLELTGTTTLGVGEGKFSFQASETEEVSLTLKYAPGDRVLALPINGGNDAIVLCKVVSGGG